MKRHFEKFLLTLKDYFLNNEINPIFIFLQKIVIGYHDVVSAFSTENRKLKILNYQLSEQYQKIDKNFIECNKTIKEKQNEIDNLGKKISTLMINLAESKKTIIFLKTKLEEIQLNNFKATKYNLDMFNNKENEKKIIIDINENNEQYKKIKNINLNNLDDLDALYFWDKVEMKPKRSYSTGKVIPYLPIININK